MNSSENFLAWLKHISDEKGLTQADIARAADVPPSTVNRWFQGSVPHRSTVSRLHSIFEPDSEGRLYQEPAAYSAASEAKFDGELDRMTMSQLILIARSLSLAPFGKDEIMHRIFRRMEKLEAQSK